MNFGLGGEKRLSKSRYTNVIRESDIRADPDYKKKKEFFDELEIQVQLNCSKLKENACKEALNIYNSLALLILQLPKRVQNMTVNEFCEEFGFELLDGNLSLKEENISAATRAQYSTFHTVTKQRRQELNGKQLGMPHDDVLSQLQIVRHPGVNDTFLRLSKNSLSYDLTKQKMSTLSAAEKEFISSEIVSFQQLLNSIPNK